MKTHGFTLIELMIVLAVLGLVAFIIGGGCFNYNGANHTKASTEAKAYAKHATDAGADVKFISCTDHDTDGDGYLACSFLVDGQPVTLDCAGKNIVQDNHGCKEYVAKLQPLTLTKPRGTAAPWCRTEKNMRKHDNRALRRNTIIPSRAGYVARYENGGYKRLREACSLHRPRRSAVRS